jgi:Papain-like cysteine protease AvrRpt2
MIRTLYLAGSLLLFNSHLPAIQPITESVLIRDVPHVLQKPDFCGEACVASWLQKLGIDADQDHVFDASGLPPALARGCYTRELATAIRQLGFDAGPVWYAMPADPDAVELEKLWQATLNDLKQDIPSIICMRTSEQGSEHFRLLLGYDANKDEVIYHEPAEANGAYRRMPRQTLFNLWPLKYRANQWTLIHFALKLQQRPTVSPTSNFTAADYAQHIMHLQSRLPHDGFTILIEHPFVVVGDEAADVVQRRAEQTVRWATTKLKAQYFAKDPNQILDVWLFKDKASYDSNTLRLFGETPSTPYGYYSPSQRALVMNIATGGGTLVHEIVHPFIEANFPDCPAWFNEGLGSLYEQSQSRDEQIVGMTNWRLAGLQRAIADDRVPSFGTLCATTTNQFYRSDPGTNYSQARYLCYYLQEQGLLQNFYRDFVANHASDPTGYQTLQQTLGNPDMITFRQDWEAYVMKLEF